MSSSNPINPAVKAALTAVESRRAAQRQAELEDLEADLEAEDVSDESDEGEDEYGEELTPAMDAAILRTLRMIRSGKGVYEGERVIEGGFLRFDVGVEVKLGVWGEEANLVVYASDTDRGIKGYKRPGRKSEIEPTSSTGYQSTFPGRLVKD